MADTTNRGGNVGQKAQDPISAARQTAHEAKSTLQEAAGAASQRAQELGQTLAQKAQDVASSAGEKAESAISSVGQGMSSLGGTVREKAPREGVIGSAATAVADRLQSGGHYLQEHRLSDMAEDFSTLIRNHPMPSLLVAFGVGWCMGALSRR